MAVTAPARIAASPTPYDSIQRWSSDVLASMSRDGDETALPPSWEALEEVLRALGALQEFLIDPIADRLQSLVDADAEHDHGRGRVPEGARLFDYADVGRYIVWADTMREELGHALAGVTKVALLAHEDIAHIAGGWIPLVETTKPGPGNEHLRRFYGLDVVA